jgi:hypothetical protein
MPFKSGILPTQIWLYFATLSEFVGEVVPGSVYETACNTVAGTP